MGEEFLWNAFYKFWLVFFNSLIRVVPWNIFKEITVTLISFSFKQEILEEDFLNFYSHETTPLIIICLLVNCQLTEKWKVDRNIIQNYLPYLPFLLIKLSCNFTLFSHFFLELRHRQTIKVRLVVLCYLTTKSSKTYLFLTLDINFICKNYLIQV